MRKLHVFLSFRHVCPDTDGSLLPTRHDLNRGNNLSTCAETTEKQLVFDMFFWCPEVTRECRGVSGGFGTSGEGFGSSFWDPRISRFFRPLFEARAARKRRSPIPDRPYFSRAHPQDDVSRQATPSNYYYYYYHCYYYYLISLSSSSSLLLLLSLL